MQVFRPLNPVRSDGLYPYRYFVYVGALLAPSTMAALAFINPHWGYMSQGAFCSLPLRPFWYRLALAWIPRYLIAIIVLGLAVAIYAHVGFEFRSLSDMVQTSKPSISTTTALSVREIEDGPEAVPLTPDGMPNPGRRGSSASMSGNSRRVSITIPPFSPPERLENAGQSQPSLDSLCLAANDTAATTPQIVASSTTPLDGPPPVEPDGNRSTDETSPLSHCPTENVQRQLIRQRARIHRQLRLMFIYPIVYILMWIIPFVNHCMQYHDKWAAHPLFWLSLLSIMCVTLMGAADSFIFSLRERPWRHIAAADGTFFGSFFCWHRASVASSGASISGPHWRPETPQAVAREPGWMSSFMNVGRSMTGGSSDQAKERVELARARLWFEREDRRAASAGAKVGSEKKRRQRPELDTIESPGTELDVLDLSGEGAEQRKKSNAITGHIGAREDEDEKPEA